jgi:acetylornithine/succinyldiaminopimelate/putrescine aminotransferase
MRNELNQFKTLFEQVRGLGILMGLPNDTHSKFSDHITVWFSENHNVTSITFGERYNEKVEIMRYSHRDEKYKVTFPIDITDEELSDLLQMVNEEYRKAKIAYLEMELYKLKEDDLVELEREEVVA